MLSNMGLIYFLFVATIVGLVPLPATRAMENHHEKMQAIKNECMQEHSVNKSEIEAFMAETDLRKGTIGAQSEKLLCFRKCFHEKIGALDEDGTVNMDWMDAMLNRIDKDNAEYQRKAKACLEKVGKIENCKDMEKMDVCIKK